MFFVTFFSSFHNKLFSVNVKQLYLFRFQTISSIQLQFIQYSLHIFHINSKHNIYVYAIIHVKQSHSYFRLVYILITIITVIIMIIIHALKLTLTTGRDLLETGIVGKILWTSFIYSFTFPIWSLTFNLQLVTVW